MLVVIVAAIEIMVVMVMVLMVVWRWVEMEGGKRGGMCTFLQYAFITFWN